MRATRVGKEKHGAKKTVRARKQKIGAFETRATRGGKGKHGANKRLKTKLFEQDTCIHNV